MAPVDAKPWKATRKDLSENDRARYDQLALERAKSWTGKELALYASSWVCLFGPTVVLIGISWVTGEWTGYAVNTRLVVVGVASVVLWLGLAISSLIIQMRRRRAAREQMQALLDAVPPPRPRRRDRDGEDGADWARYPVTGYYNPELYYARGGRSTARGMETWGVDYETYRSNVE
jgi:hypothetical protein